MDFPIHIDAISMGLTILYFKGSQIEFLKKYDVFLPLEVVLNLANRVFTLCQSTLLGVSSIRRVNYLG